MAEATQKTANYTAEMVDSIIEMYNELGNDGLDEIADSIGKSVRSVRSKLVREGVYVASPKKAAAKQDGPSKKEILRDIEAVGFDVSGFEGATKAALTRLMGVVATSYTLNSKGVGRGHRSVRRIFPYNWLYLTQYVIYHPQLHRW